MSIRAEYWEDVIPDPKEDLDAYERFYDALHEYEPGKRYTWTDEQGNIHYGSVQCKALVWRRNEQVECGRDSHSSCHEPIDGCCYCKHGVYLHTSYDIPCGRCEMGDEYDD